VTEREFGNAYLRWSSSLRRYVYRIVGSAADVDDIVQEAFLRTLRAGLRGDDEEPWRRYLYRVATNLIVDRWRRRKHERVSETMHEPASPRPQYEDEATVAKIFGELKPRERTLLWLAYVEGESHEQIAASLGVGRRSVKVMLIRAKRHLRDLLQARGILANEQ
jgi:RNA polymerase sigma-70 factor (ECF subfamily)